MIRDKNKSEQTMSPQSRDIRRNCGPLLGQPDALLLGVYISQFSSGVVFNGIASSWQIARHQKS